MDASRQEQSPSRVEASDRLRWARTTAFGLGLVGLTLLVSSVHLLVVGALAGPVLVLPVIGVVSLAAALLARRGTRGALITSLVVAVLVLLGNLGHLTDTLGLPASPWDFVPNLAAFIGLLVAIASAVGGLRTASTTDDVQHWARLAAVIALVVGTAGSLALSMMGPEPLPPDAVVVATVANDYQPEAVQVSPGDVIGLRNQDAYGHTFTVIDLGIDVGLPGNGTATVPIDPDTPPGTYDITCVLHPQIMVGTLTVATP